MEDKIKIEDLPQEQQEYVREYQRILHGLSDISDSLVLQLISRQIVSSWILFQLNYSSYDICLSLLTSFY